MGVDEEGAAVDPRGTSTGHLGARGSGPHLLYPLYSFTNTVVCGVPCWGRGAPLTADRASVLGRLPRSVGGGSGRKHTVLGRSHAALRDFSRAVMGEEKAVLSPGVLIGSAAKEGRWCRASEAMWWVGGCLEKGIPGAEQSVQRLPHSGHSVSRPGPGIPSTTKSHLSWCPPGLMQAGLWERRYRIRLASRVGRRGSHMASFQLGPDLQ